MLGMLCGKDKTQTHKRENSEERRDIERERETMQYGVWRAGTRAHTTSFNKNLSFLCSSNACQEHRLTSAFTEAPHFDFLHSAS